MDEVFYDRYGRKKYANDVIPQEQKGYFAILLKDGKVLLTYPPAVDVPEFPGGKVSRKEGFRECLFRKLYEETGIEFMLSEGKCRFQQKICYFAEDARPYGAYCLYDMNFFVYDASTYGFDTRIVKKKTPENGMSQWVVLQDIIDGRIKINYAHWLAFKEIFKEEIEESLS